MNATIVPLGIDAVNEMAVMAQVAQARAALQTAKNKNAQDLSCWCGRLRFHQSSVLTVSITPASCAARVRVIRLIMSASGMSGFGLVAAVDHGAQGRQSERLTLEYRASRGVDIVHGRVVV